MTFIGDEATETADDPEITHLREQLIAQKKSNAHRAEMMRVSHIQLDPMSVIFSRIDALAEAVLTDEAAELRFGLIFETKMAALLKMADDHQRSRLLRP